MHAARGASWQSLATTGEYLIAFVTIAVLARILSPSEFGIVTLALSFLNFARLFSEIAMAPALIRQREITDGHVNVAYMTVATLGILAGIVIAVPSHWAATFFRAPPLQHMLWAVALLVPINAFTSVSMALLSRRGDYRFIAISNFPGVLIGYCLTSIVLAVLGFGAWSLIIGVITQQVIAGLLRFVATRHRLRLRWDTKAFKDLLAISSGQTIGGWINYLATNGDSFVAGRMLGLSAVGLYGRAYRLMMLPVEIISAGVFRVIFPAMSSVQDDMPRLRRAYVRGLSLLMGLLMPAAIFVAFAAKPLVLLILGGKWLGAVAPTRILFLSLPFRAAYRLVNLPVLIKGKIIALVILNTIYAILVIGGAIAAAGMLGTVAGVALAVAFALLAFYAMSSYTANGLLSIGWLEFAKLHQPGLASAAALAIALPLAWLAPWLGVSAAGDLVTYLAIAGVTAWLLSVGFPRFFLGKENLAFLSPLAGTLPVVGASISRWMDQAALAPAPETGAGSSS